MIEEMKLETVWAPENNADISYEFEDNFKPFLKMHDSTAYIAALEKRLSKIKNSHAPSSGKAMIDSLFKASDDHMSNHLKDGITSNGFLPEDDDLSLTSSDPATVKNLLIGKLYPEKLAISNEELIHLLSSDKLNISKQLSDLNDQPTN